MQETISMLDESAKGLITVELFEDGKKVEQVDTHNFISKATRDWYFKLAIATLFTRERPNGAMDYTRNYIADPFRIISLTDATHQEDSENEFMRRGKVIGNAYTNGTYSGNDTIRGTYNQAESFTRPDHVRMVFDFPTHACNGTFQSIYFHEEAPTEIAFTGLNRIDTVGGTRQAHFKFQKYGNNYYGLRNYSTGYGRYIDVFNLNFEYVETYYFNGNNIYDFWIYNDFLYTITTSELYKSHLSAPTERTRIASYRTLTRLDGTTVTAYYCGIIVKNGEIYILANETSSGSSNWCFEMRYDLEGVFIEYRIRTFDRSYNLGYNYGKLMEYGDNVLLLIYNTGIYTFELLSDTEPEYINSGGYTSYIGDDFRITTNGYLNPLNFISSRSLLPNPITKTNTQTMKITYDFVLPKPLTY